MQNGMGISAGGEANRSRTWLGLAMVGLVAVLAGCSPGKALLDDRNPFYLRGLRLRQENKFEEAADAFAKCLRLSPGSAKAHLQLAMLYEDRLGDPLKAAYHYHEYLRQAPSSENREMVQKWVTRAERTMLQQLVDKYPEDVDILLGKSQAGQGVPTLSAREQYLIQRVRKMGVEIVSLREALAKSAGGTPVGGSAMPPPAPEPRVEEPPATAEGPIAEPVSDAPTESVGKTVAPPALAPPPASGAGKAVAPAKSGASATTNSAAVQSGTEPAGGAGAGTGIGTVPEPAKSFVPIRRLSSGGLPPSTTGAPNSTDNVAPRKAVTYIVQKGDTLTCVAKKLCGSSSSWKLLQDANRDVLKGSSVLRPGMTLRVPDRSANSGSGKGT